RLLTNPPQTNRKIFQCWQPALHMLYICQFLPILGRTKASRPHEAAKPEQQQVKDNRSTQMHQQQHYNRNISAAKKTPL
ncbi:hypothetical protein SOVF_206050, partial [Spinacia oleracea]